MLLSCTVSEYSEILVKKITSRFEKIPACYGQTDTWWQHIPRYCTSIASPGKNHPLASFYEASGFILNPSTDCWGMEMLTPIVLVLWRQYSTQSNSSHAVDKQQHLRLRQGDEWKIFSFICWSKYFIFQSFIHNFLTKAADTATNNASQNHKIFGECT